MEDRTPSPGAPRADRGAWARTGKRRCFGFSSSSTVGTDGEVTGLLAEGQLLETVLLGQPFAGYIAIWDRQNAVSYWRIEDPDALTDRLGRGVTARSEVLPQRFRESAALNLETGALVLLDRFIDADGNGAGEHVALHRATAEDAHAAADEDDPWRWAHQLGTLMLAAAQRGEFLALETGGWEVPYQPFLLSIVVEEGDRSISVVETAPIPTDAEQWRDYPPPTGARSQSLSAPATVESVAAGGTLAVLAWAEWGIHRLDVGLSFGSNPAGPWTP